MFNSNVSPRIRKKDRGDRTWQCLACGKENKPWWRICAFCSKPKD